MKNLIILLFTTFTLSCCNEEEDNNSKTELEKLPPVTQSGANTAGCLVNGVAFLPKGFFPTGNLFFFYQDGKDFSLSIGERTLQGDNDIIKNINITSLNQNLHDNVGVSIELGQNENNGNSKFGVYSIDAVAPPNPKYYSTNSIIKGELKINYHNYNQAILSGTFWFDAINSNGEIVQVREGRFDIRY